MSLFKTTYFKYFLSRRLFRCMYLKFCWYNSTLKAMNTKPPNILVYTGESCPKLFKEIYNNLQKCLQSDRYTIYHLLESEINDHPWMENTLLLIISSEVIKNNIAQIFESFFKNFGSILLICSKFNDSLIGSKCFQISDKESAISVNLKESTDTILYHGKYSYDTCGTVLYHDTSGKPLVHRLKKNNSIFICSEVYLDRDFQFSTLPSNYNSNNRLLILKKILSEEFGLEVTNDNFVPQLTPGNYISKNEFESIKHVNNKEIVNSTDFSLFYECKLNYSDELIKLPIYFCKNSIHPMTFNLNTYYSKLNTKHFGHDLVYFPVITSTMDVTNQLSEYEGIVVAAGCQIKGKGRGSNQWISPKGCAMFTLHFTVSLCSQLGKRMSLLQHISSLAVVHGIRSQPTLKNLELKIKWPNDIYYNDIKLGGLIATSVVQKDTAHVYIGWGINVENRYPTTCLNDVIDKYNSENSLPLPHLSVEEVIAYTLSQMEYLVRDYTEHGPENFFTLYYSYWMHGDQKVFLKNLNEQGTVIGLDDYGFLRVKTNKGKIVTLQPDGNRFDIMKNLIYSI